MITRRRFDRTAGQAPGVFLLSNARALVMSGSHRCAVSHASGCTANEGLSVDTHCGTRPAGPLGSGDPHAYGTADMARRSSFAIAVL